MTRLARYSTTRDFSVMNGRNNAILLEWYEESTVLATRQINQETISKRTETQTESPYIY